MATYHYVPKHRWSEGKDGTHPGYRRRNRPAGKKRIISKRPMRGLYTVRNENGQFLGYKFKE